MIYKLFVIVFYHNIYKLISFSLSKSSTVLILMHLTFLSIFLINPAKVLPGPISTKVSTPLLIIFLTLCSHLTGEEICLTKSSFVFEISLTYSPVTFVTYGISNSVKFFPTPQTFFLRQFSKILNETDR